MPHNNIQDKQQARNNPENNPGQKQERGRLNLGADRAGPERDESGGQGILYGIGVGPGDPDLLTMRAVKSLGEVDVILAASSSKNDYSIAHNIALPHLPSGVETLRLGFPMTRDADELQKAWENNAAAAAKVLRQGRNAAFLTLGDPLIFSTFGYLLRELLKLMPELEVRIEPGITSFQEAAAVSRTMLCSAGENFLLVSGVNSRERLVRDLRMADNAAILKAYRNLPVIAAAVEEARRTVKPDIGGEAGHSSQAAPSSSFRQSPSTPPSQPASSANTASPVFVSRLGFADQRICRDLTEITETPHYLSLLLLGKKF